MSEEGIISADIEIYLERGSGMAVCDRSVGVFYLTLKKRSSSRRDYFKLETATTTAMSTLSLALLQLVLVIIISNNIRKFHSPHFCNGIRHHQNIHI